LKSGIDWGVSVNDNLKALDMLLYDKGYLADPYWPFSVVIEFLYFRKSNETV